MKRHCLILGALLLSMLKYSHGAELVTIVDPTNQSTFSYVTNISVSVTATNPVSPITNMSLFIDGKLHASTTNTPYAFNWTNPPAGAYTLMAGADDLEGYMSISLPVDVVVYQGWTGGGTNFAKNKTATQSSTGYSPASYAVDGNTNGNWYASTVSHTGADAQAWWEVDLGSVEQLAGVRVWNRTDCCGSRLSNFYLLVSDSSFTSTALSTVTNQSGVSSYYHSGAAGTLTSIEVNRTGRYLRIQLTGTDYLHLAEVEVLGPSPAPTAPGQLVAEALSPAQVALRWTNGTVAETKIERQNPGDNRYYVIGVAPSGAASFIDSGLETNQSYTYRIRAGNSAGFSAYSSEVTVTTDESGNVLPLEDLELWLRADAGVQLNGTNVIEWMDQSGKAFSFTQSTSSKQPSYVTNGFQNGPSIRFGSGKLLSHTTSNLLSSGSARTLVFVGKADASGSGGTLLTIRRSTLAYWVLLGTFGGYHYTFSDGVNAANNAYGPSDLVTRIRTPFIAVQKTAGSGTKIGTSLSGEALSITQAGSFPSETGSVGCTIGGTEIFSGYDWRGDIAEVLVFSRELNASEQLVLERYVNRKYEVVPIPSVTNLEAQPLSASQVFLSWNNSGATTNTSFTVERKVGSGGSYAVVAVLTNKSTFIDTNLTGGTTYFYRVKGSHPFSGESPFSNEANATTLTAANWPLTNLSVWLRADKISGTPVASWEDLSGKGNHAVQATAGYRPNLLTNSANGRPTLQFDGTDDRIEIPTSIATNVFTVFAVAKVAVGHEVDPETQTGWPGNSGQRYLLSCTPYGSSNPGLNTTNSGANISLGTNGLSYYNFQQPSIGTPPNLAEAVYEGPVGSGFNLVECSVSDRTALLFLNGGFVREGLRSQRETILAPVQIGGYSYGYFQGEIAEVLIFDKVLSLAEKQSIYAYLNQRYELAASSPAAPSGLAASGVSLTQVSLIWTNSGSGSMNVYIERKQTGESQYQFVAGVPATATAFLDDSLSSGTEYSYRIRSENLAGYSEYSAVAIASTLSNGASIPVSDITLWLRADGVSTANPSSYVSKWLDESTRRNHAVQSSASQQPIRVADPINARPTYRFDGTNDMLRIATSPATNEFSIFVVARPEAAHEVDIELSSANNPAWLGQRYVVVCGIDSETLGSFFTAGSGGAGLSLGTNGSTVYELQQNAIGGQSSTPFIVYENAIPQAASLQELVVGARSASLYLNGSIRRTSTGSLRTNVFAPVHIGGFAAGSAGYHQGDIAEVLIFKKVLSSSERKAVETYLNAKYALVSEVPPAPAALVAVGVSASQISLSWTATSTNSIDTYIERKTGTSGTFEVVAVADSKATSYLDHDLDPGTGYVYRIRQENLAGFSHYSSEASAATLGTGDAIPIDEASLWLKADGVVGMNQSSYVSRWDDLSNWANHGVQNSASAQPAWLGNQVNGRPALRFSRTNDHMIVPFTPGTNDFVVFALAKALDGHQIDSLGDTSAGGSGQKYIFGTKNAVYPYHSGQSGLSAGTNGFSVYDYEYMGSVQWPALGVYANTNLTNFALYSVGYTAGRPTLFLNGGAVLIGSASPRYHVYGSTSIGDERFAFNGDIAEVLAFPRSLTPAEMDSVSRYFMAKYAITNTAPQQAAAISVKAFSSTSLSISWSPTALNHSGVEIQRKLSTNGTYETLTFIQAGQTNYMDSVSPTNAVSYQVRSAINGTYSAFSEAAPPKGAITSPSNGSLVQIGSTNTITTDCTATFGSVQKVELYVSGTVVSTNTAAPFSFSWVPSVSDTYSLSLKITDSSGNTRFSEAVMVLVAAAADQDGDGLTDSAEIAIGTDPADADTDGDSVSDSVDAFPLDPTRSSLPSPDPNDTTPPTISLELPVGATLLP